MDADTATTSERREATVMYADIAGFTATSEKMDPEAATDFMNRCFALLEGIVMAHGGVVDKYLGDCAVGVFATDSAGANAATHAVRAACEMRAAVQDLNRELHLPAALDVHIGIASGPVMVGEIGGAVRRDRAVIGDTVNLAARLADTAASGQIVVGEQTHRDTQGEFEYRPLPPIGFEESREPAPAYELRGVRTGRRRLKRDSERRQVTVVFADVAGFKPLADTLEPERFTRLLNRCFTTMESAVRNHGGVVDKFIGDCVMALFGAPNAIENAPKQAINAAIEMRNRLSLFAEEEGLAGALSVRIGINTGLVIAGEIGGRLRRDFTVMGDAVNLASRLKDAAKDGAIYVGAETYRYTRDEFEFVALPPLALKGKERPVAAYEVASVTERVHRAKAPAAAAAAARTIFSELVGRDHELAEVARAADRLTRGRGGIVSVIGEAGIGKSRLMAETLALERLRHVTVLEGRSLSIGQGLSFHLFVDLLRQWAGIADGDGNREAAGKLARAVRELLPAALDDELAVLAEKQLVTERQSRETAAVRRTMLMAEREYTFKHALAQEAIYGSLLQKTRKELHLQVAGSIEALFAERLVDFYGMLAYHYSRAEHPEKAEEYLFKAGEEAARAAASSEALNFFREASRLYLAIHGAGGDPRKKALLEKNIALALLNTGNLTESIEHFDAALEFLGERIPLQALAIYLTFALNLAAVLYHLYARGGRRSARPSTELEREVFEVIYYRARPLTTSDPQRLFIDNIGGIRRLNRVDPSAIDQACGMYAGSAALFAFTGFSFDVSRRFLAIARSLIRPGNIRDRFVCRSMEFIHHYLKGDWEDEHAIDDELTEQALRIGQLWDVNTYAGLDCDRLLRQGNFAAARERLERLAEMRDDYGFAFAAPNHDIMTALLLLEQRAKLGEALQIVTRYHAARHEDALKVLGLGTLAKIAMLLGDRAAARSALERAAEIVGRSRQVPPWHLGAFTVARLGWDVTALEECAAAADTAQRAALRRRVKKSAELAVQVASKVAAPRTETYRLAGRSSWLLGQRVAALKWWQRSVEVGARLDARPELARTFQEVGQRLAAVGDARITFNGLDAAACFERARALFTQMGLTADLAALDTAAREQLRLQA